MKTNLGTPEERRARKLARREKQRAANVERALKMHSSRLACPAASHKASPLLPDCNIGCSGWFYWHWRQSLYPDDLPTKDWFSHYAAHFRTVELNAPFYSWPTVNTVKAWLRQVESRDFVYTLGTTVMPVRSGTQGNWHVSCKTGNGSQLNGDS
ncbi:MAG: DUF72 domain-containing protein [Limisphaerales bacterium]